MSLGLCLSLDGYVTVHVRDPINYRALNITPTVEGALRELVELGIPIEHPDLLTRVRNSLLIYRDRVIDNNKSVPRFMEKHVPQVRALIWNALVECGLTSQYEDDDGSVWLNLNSFHALVNGKRYSSFDDPLTDYQFGIMYFKAQYPYMDFDFEQKIETLQQAAEKEQWLAEEAQIQLQQGRVGAIQTVRLRMAVKAHTARAKQLEDEALQLRWQRDCPRLEMEPGVNDAERGQKPVTPMPVPLLQTQPNPATFRATAKNTSHYIPAHLLASSSNSASSSSQQQTHTTTNTMDSSASSSNNHPLIEAILRAKAKQNSEVPVASAVLSLSSQPATAELVVEQAGPGQPLPLPLSRERPGSQPHPMELPLRDPHVLVVATTPVSASIQPATVANLAPMDRSGATSREYAGGGGDTVRTTMTAMDSSSSPPMQIFATPSEDARSVDASAVTHQTSDKAAGQQNYGDNSPTADTADGSNPYRVSSPAERLGRKQAMTYRSQRYQSFQERLQRLIRVVRTDHQQQLARDAARRQTLQELGSWVEGSPLETKTNFRSKVYTEIDRLSSSYRKKFESNIVEMVSQWEASVACQLKAEIKSARTIYNTLDHYEEKVVSLQQKHSRQPTGTDAAQNLRNKLERNQHKLQEAAAEYSDCRDRLERLDKTMEHDWILIFPLLVKLLQTDMDEAKERATVMALLEDSLRELSESVQRHGLDPQVPLNSLEMWSFLYTNGVAAAPTSVNDAVKEAGVAADASANTVATEREKANIQNTSCAVPEDHASLGSVSDQLHQQLGSEHGLASMSGTIPQQKQHTLHSSDQDRGVVAVAQDLSIPVVEETVKMGELSVPTAELMNNDDNPQHHHRRIPVDPSVIVIRDEIPPAPAVDEVEPARHAALDNGNGRVDAANGTETTNPDSRPLPHPQRQPVGASAIGIRAENHPVVCQSEPLTPTTLGPSDALGDNEKPRDHPGGEESFVVIEDEGHGDGLEMNRCDGSDSFQPIDEVGRCPLPIYLPSIESVGEAVGNRDDGIKKAQIDPGEMNMFVDSFLKPSLEVNAFTEAIPNHSGATIDATAAIGGIGSGLEQDATDGPDYHNDSLPTSSTDGGGSPERQHQPYTDGAEKLLDHDAEGIDEFLSEVCAVEPTVSKNKNGNDDKLFSEDAPDTESQITQNVTDPISDYKENIAGDCKTEEVFTPKRGGDPPANDDRIQHCYEGDDDETDLSRHTVPELVHHQPVSSDPEVVLDSPVVDLRPADDNLFAACEPGEIVDAKANGNADNEFEQAWGSATNESVDHLTEPKTHVDADADDFADVLDAAALVAGSDSLISEFHSAAAMEEGSRIGYLC